jgi:hypothetical protein
MRPSAQLIERFADTLVRRLVHADFVELLAPETAVRARVARLLTENFEQEAAIDAAARDKAEQLVRQGAPGVRREELDLRRVEQLMKQRIAKERGFVL